MKSALLIHFPLPWLTCIGLVLFFLAFVGIFARAYAKSSAPLHRRLEQLPLNDEGASHE